MKKIPILYAPTATGKTAILLKIAKSFSLDVCSMDSMQVYKEMDIGTAKPTLEEQQSCPHHLIDLVYPDEPFDVNRYRNLALKKIEELEQKGRFFLFAGGTGLYMDVLRYGLFQGVSKDDQIRQKLISQEAEYPGFLRRELYRIDPVSAEKIHPNDRKRTVRALEVFYLCGKTFSELGQSRTPDERFRLVFLIPDRKKLYERINLRVEQMVEKGLVEETRHLMKKYPSTCQSMKAIGYQETIAYLNNHFTCKNDYLETLKKNTRHFAKRQMIWARRYQEAMRVEITDQSEQAVMTVLEKLFY
ncbi:MAG TPA: tRNA (adenosine(37)-N6)-dimethylallyltransferase MiaA [Thermotogota bacterium]|nr:tRNA (adenosine(37)-N6)-dimethylallyltransferase MiaA [Thermotogota bacterium]HRW34521.1 tRNA (adenosine(37)-N6)-dimethylallyltransferase MiaA [Thermotogota bacterium]